MKLDNLDRLRFERGAAHLHRLGARATAELLAEVAESIGGAPCILARLADYERRLTPAMVRAADADRMPSRPLRRVPQ
jgi:hypothetical protein